MGDAGLYIGLMSGTSLDGVDAVLARFDDRPHLLAHGHWPFPESLRTRIRRLARPGDDHLDDLGALDGLLGNLYGDCVLDLLKRQRLAPEAITAIGCHGQTLRHRPLASPPFSLQAGDPNRLAWRTGITTVADFRRMDLAAGGQGAPLAPPFHAWCLGGGDLDQAVLNLGGIANLTLLPADRTRPVRGFDTGPANTLMDAWCRRHLGTPYDRDGALAGRGRVRPDWLEAWLADPWFAEAPPKSTGPEHFHLKWAMARANLHEAPHEDVLASLAALTVESVARALKETAPGTRRLWVCGGGVYNASVIGGLKSALPDVAVASTAERGLHPQWIEAAAFAWLARERLAGRPGNLPTVTGAARAVLLGGIYAPD